MPMDSDSQEPASPPVKNPLRNFRLEKKTSYESSFQKSFDKSPNNTISINVVPETPERRQPNGEGENIKYSSTASKKTTQSSGLSIEPILNSQGSVSIKPVPVAVPQEVQKLPSGLTITKVVQSTTPKKPVSQETAPVRVVNIGRNSSAIPGARKAVNTVQPHFEGNLNKRSVTPVKVPSTNSPVTPSKVLSANLSVTPNKVPSADSPVTPNRAAAKLPVTPDRAAANLPVTPNRVSANRPVAPNRVPPNLPVTPNRVPPNLPVTPNRVPPNLPVTSNRVPPNLPVTPNRVPPNLPVTPNRVPLNLPVTPNRVPLNLPATPNRVPPNLPVTPNRVPPNLPVTPNRVPPNLPATGPNRVSTANLQITPNRVQLSNSTPITPNRLLSAAAAKYTNAVPPVKGVTPLKQTVSRPKVVEPTPAKEVPVSKSVAERQAIMNDYDVFCTKEQSLRKLLKTFPGADIMEAQDILVDCAWNVDKAIELARTRPLRVISRRRSSSNSNYVGIPSNFSKGVVFDSENAGGQRSLTITDVKGNVTEEIVLESSDDDSVEAIQENSNICTTPSKAPVSFSSITPIAVHRETSIESCSTVNKRAIEESETSDIENTPARKKVKRVISVEDSDEEETASNSSLSVETTVQPTSEQQAVTAVNDGNKANEQLSETSLLGSSVDISLRTSNATPENGEKASGQSSPASSCTSSTDNFLKTKDTNKKSKKKKDFDTDDDEYEAYGENAVYDSDDSDSGETLTPGRSAVLSFFQDATNDELLTIPGCSKKKAETIVGYRPFAGWADLVQKLNSDKSLSTDLLNGTKQVIDMRAAINRIMNKCQKIAGEMEGMVENLKGMNEGSKEYLTEQPAIMNDKMHLTPYQMLGLNWLILMHNQEVNGILADEMGLGKTVQAISLLAYLKEQQSIEVPHLIVVPSSTLDNWKNELEMWWPSVSILLYHGAQESRRELRYRIINDDVDEFDVMLTTYNMVTSSNEDKSFFKRLSFYFVIFDEAHMLKNMASQRYQSLMRVRAERRLLLTGTPLQNNLVELMSLLIFVMPEMFSSKIQQIKQMFSAVSKSDEGRSKFEREQIEHAKRIMKPFVLRRLKSEVLQDLPPKEEETRFCVMTEFQKKSYVDLVTTLSAEVIEKRDKMLSGSGMMMQLRKAANHPLLLRNYFDSEKLKEMSEKILNEPTHKEANPDLVLEDMQVMSDFELHRLCKQYKSLSSFELSDDIVLDSGKFNYLDSILPEMKEKDNRILLFSQFTMVLDIVEEYMKIRNYKYLRLDGSVPVSVRQPLIDQFNGDPEIFIFLLSTRAGGLGINLTAANVVLLHDIDFNPYNDKQAEDRCHRVGQLRSVLIIRMISKDTIEEGILQRVKEKLKLEKDITSSDGDNEEDDNPGVATLLKEALGLSKEDS